MNSSVITLVPPAVEPVSPDEVFGEIGWGHCDVTQHSSKVKRLIVMAREYCEMFTRRQFITSTKRLTMDRFPSVIEVPTPPLQPDDIIIRYVDIDGVDQTLDAEDYIVDTSSEPGRIVPAHGERWPSTRRQINSVEVDFKSGYGDNPHDVPASIREAIIRIAVITYELPSDVVIGTSATKLPWSVTDLLWANRVSA